MNLRPLHRGSLQRRRSVAFFGMPENGHFQRLRPLISGLSEAGITAHVFTHARFRPQVERVGGVFFDLFARYPLETADDESIPVPSRYVTYAARYAERIRRDVERTKASLIVHDTFAVIGRVVASLLDIPRVKTSRACLEAVKTLRESYGVKDATPFSYVSSISPNLNIYCEPPEFLEEDERPVFEPIAFYGSLLSAAERREEGRRDRPWFRLGGSREAKVYVSFGTVVWRYYAGDAIRALNMITAAFAGLKELEAIISLGGAAVGRSSVAGWIRPNIFVEDYVDQGELLREAGVFITHQGMNSTHEAIFHGVPMVSYPFFMDQPELAARCRKFGLAVPLADSPRGEFGEDQVRASLVRLAEERDSMRAALARAREWELAVMAERPSVHRRILDLMG